MVFVDPFNENLTWVCLLPIPRGKVRTTSWDAFSRSINCAGSLSMGFFEVLKSLCWLIFCAAFFVLRH